MAQKKKNRDRRERIRQRERERNGEALRQEFVEFEEVDYFDELDPYELGWKP